MCLSPYLGAAGARGAGGAAGGGGARGGGGAEAAAARPAEAAPPGGGPEVIGEVVEGGTGVVLDEVLEIRLKSTLPETSMDAV